MCVTRSSILRKLTWLRTANIDTGTEAESHKYIGPHQHSHVTTGRVNHEWSICQLILQKVQHTNNATNPIGYKIIYPFLKTEVNSINHSVSQKEKSSPEKATRVLVLEAC